MKRVLLVSMPFASVRYPSAALSQLKALLRERGIPCEVAYLNVLFRAFSNLPNVYEGIADLIMLGERVFGGILFGDQWSRSDRGRLESIDSPLLPEERHREGILGGLAALSELTGPFTQKCLDTFPWNQYDVIGFTSVYSQHIASLALARRIKERWPDKIIAFGGANCYEEMGRALLRLFPFVDWVFNGQADLSFPEAVIRWSAGEAPHGVAGVAYRGGDGIVDQGAGRSPEMDSLPYPDFDDYFRALQKWAPDHLDSAPISLELSRGCWWGSKSQCTFCGLNCRSVAFRSKSAHRAEAEIRQLTERYGTDRVILTDSIVNMRFFTTLFPALAEWGGLEELFLEAKANLHREQVRLLKASGVSHFQPGIESLDTEMLSYMRKGTTLLQNIQFLKWAKEFGLYPTWNLLYGFPGENPEAYRRMAALVPSIVHLCPPMDLSPVLFVRFSPLLEESQSRGLSNIRAHSGYRSIYPFASEDLNELAYFFDCDFAGKDTIASYIEPLKNEVIAWKQSWMKQGAPELLCEQVREDRIRIHDSRPCSANRHEELNGEQALTYWACDTARSFESLRRETAQQRGRAYCGDDFLRRSLDQLVARRLMLREKDRYLSLAIRPRLDLEASEDWS
jgi:ribosomal peptide maturation radical SAM protein 1